MPHKAEPGHSFLDVIERLKTATNLGNFWIRPMAFTGSGLGYHLDGDRLVWMTESITPMPPVSTLQDAWEIVPLSVITQEQRKSCEEGRGRNKLQEILDANEEKPDEAH